jgi:hypothetical protein
VAEYIPVNVDALRNRFVAVEVSMPEAAAADTLGELKLPVSDIEIDPAALEIRTGDLAIPTGEAPGMPQEAPGTP